jgi:hypothetical protein
MNLAAEQGSILSKLNAAKILGQEADTSIAAAHADQTLNLQGQLQGAQDAISNWNPGDGSPVPQELRDKVPDLQVQLDTHQANPPQPSSFYQQAVPFYQNQLNNVQKTIAIAQQDHAVIVKNAGDSIQTSAGLANKMAGGLLQAGGTVGGKMLDAVGWANNGLDWLSQRIAGGNPVLASNIKHMALDLPSALLGAEHGGGVGGVLGFFTPEVAQVAGHAASMIGLSPRDIAYGSSVLGKELLAGQATSPFWRRVAQQTTGAPNWVARTLDNSFMNDVTRTISATANVGLEAGSINAAIANVGSQGDPKATAQGFISGGILGMAGGAYGAWKDFGTPEQLQSAQVGDRYRFLKSLDTETKTQFQQQSPELQLSMSSYFAQHPDLGLRFDGEQGKGSYYTVDTSANKATIHVDPAQPETAIHAQIAHEFNHHLEQSGMASELYSAAFGNSDAEVPGNFTKIDSGGNPVRRADGTYATNDEFAGLRDRLNQRYAAQGLPNEILTDHRVVRELASESAVGRVSPGRVVPVGTVFGDKLLDQTTAPFVTKQFTKGVLASLGNGFDSGNQIIGTGLFTGEKRAPWVDNILDSWYSGQRKLSPLDSGDPIGIQTKDLVGRTDAQLRQTVGGVKVFKEDGKGNIMRQTDGSPVLNTNTQIEKPGQAAGKAVVDAIGKMDERTRVAAGIVPDGEGGFHVPSTASINSILERHLSPEQIANLKVIQGISDVTPGSGTNLRYHPAYRRGLWKQPIPDALPVKDYSVMPMFTRVTKAGNILVNALDHGQLLENAQIAIRRGMGADWGYNAPKIVEGARTMLETMAKGLPSETVVNPQQKKFLYELTGLDPKVNGSGVFDDISRKARSESTWKTFRLDRINKVTPDSTHNWKLTNNIYDAIKGYRSGSEAFTPDYIKSLRARRGAGGEVQEEEVRSSSPKTAREEAALPLGQRPQYPLPQDYWKGNPQGQARYNAMEPDDQWRYRRHRASANGEIRSGAANLGGVLPQRDQILRPAGTQPGIAGAMASQSGSGQARQDLWQAAKAKIQEVTQPPVAAPTPSAAAPGEPQVKRAELVKQPTLSPVQGRIQALDKEFGNAESKRIIARALGFAPKYLTPENFKKYAPKDEQQFARLLDASRKLYLNTVGTAGVGKGTVAAANYTQPDGSEFPARLQAVGDRDPAAFIAHHTGGRGTVQSVIDTLNQRHLGVEYVMDRDGQVYQTGPAGSSNILPGWGPKGAGLNNKNVIGMEVIAKDDKDVTDAQKQSFARFIQMRYPNTPVFGHGEVNPGHKEADEGQSTKQAAMDLRASLRTGTVDSNVTKGWNNTRGTEFGEGDNPVHGGHSERNWDTGAWGDSLRGWDNAGAALPANVLRQFGNLQDKNFANNFNSKYQIVVKNPVTGQQTVATLKDTGPGESRIRAGVGIDLLPGTRTAIGLRHGASDHVQYTIVPRNQALASR